MCKSNVSTLKITILRLLFAIFVLIVNFSYAEDYTILNIETNNTKNQTTGADTNFFGLITEAVKGIAESNITKKAICQSYSSKSEYYEAQAQSSITRNSSYSTIYAILALLYQNKYETCWIQNFKSDQK